MSEEELAAWQARQAQATESRAEQAMRVIEKVAPGVSKHQWAINAASGILDFADAVRRHALIDAMERSHEEGRVVALG